MPELKKYFKEAGVGPVIRVEFQVLPLLVNLIDKLIIFKGQAGITLGIKQELSLAINLYQRKSRLENYIDKKRAENLRLAYEKDIVRFTELNLRPKDITQDTPENRQEFAKIQNHFQVLTNELVSTNLILGRDAISQYKLYNQNPDKYTKYLIQIQNCSPQDASTTAANKLINLRYLVDNINIMIERYKMIIQKIDLEYDQIDLYASYEIDPYVYYSQVVYGTAYAEDKTKYILSAPQVLNLISILSQGYQRLIKGLEDLQSSNLQNSHIKNY